MKTTILKGISQFLLPAVLTLTTMSSVQAATESELEFQVYNGGENSFFVNSVLVTGEKDAVLIDTQFTKAKAHQLVAEILNSGKQLKMVYISHGDPDYYFGLEVIKQAFPDVKVFATEPTVNWIKKTVDKKVGFWGPKMGANAPTKPVIPEVIKGSSFDLEGHSFNIVGLDGDLPGRTFLWVPDLKAVMGGVNVFAGLHLWTADTQTKASRKAWASTLDNILALNPTTVIPGHAANQDVQDSSLVTYNLKYLADFEQALETHKTSAALIKSMQAKYPENKLGLALEIGAKVNTGEMKW
ncbi:MBL fold metallo-hydrolase [uncultured Cocleimonas sp.]|uniref:MBL fold metallo-hydrolase n=1 Tax=uncultured Cocleimonas sp. TaxID=1051587 RepID=UPI0026060813|nr:MBL fold metallo-hydrolase [uncultured Cocleimonas sp.]